MIKRGRLLLLVIVLTLSLFFLSVVSAEELNLKITGTINNLTSDAYLKTNSNALTSVEGYDFGTLNLPSTYSQFYTTSSGENLFIDAWNWNSSRNINLTFSLDSANTGNLVFSWTLMAGSYNGEFTYCGTDIDCATPSSVDMRATDSISASVSSASTLYARVELTTYVAPASCGDGSCNNGESCSNCPGDCGACASSSSGGGGGGSASRTSPSNPQPLSIDLRDIIVDIVIGSSKKRTITIRNRGNEDQKVDIFTSGIDKLATFDSTFFILKPGESKDLEVIFSSEDEPGITVGKIYVGGNEVLVSVNTKSKQLLFDASITVPSSKKIVSKGGKLSSQIILIPMGDLPREDVTLNYIITDYEGNVYLKESETVLVENQVNFKKEFDLMGLPPGKYVLGLEMVYSNGIATSSAHFEVSDKAGISSTFIYLVIIGAVVFAMLVIVFIKIRSFRIAAKKYKNKSN
ncbi:MAG: hypothetical protein ABH840_04530 [Nanoarchaeota archaeon]